MPRNKIVYIIGFMGSGKSTAGRKLALSLGWKFIDLDRKIEEFAGKTIPDIFEQDGESHFRMIESEILQKVGSFTETIVSTGGGTPCHDDNMEYMLSTGLTVYLKMTPEQLARRLQKSSGERPLIKNVPDEHLETFIEKMLTKREKWYGRASLIVDGMSVDYSLLNNLIIGKFELI
jgi:shikimate kinase